MSKTQALYEAAGGYDYEYRLKDALAGLGLKDIHDREDFTDLSGGEKMRVCLARLIVDRPDVLLLDEPTNHLDMEAVEWLENYCLLMAELFSLLLTTDILLIRSQQSHRIRRRSHH